MDIRRLRAFRTIVETGGLTRAAGILHQTPGALSKAMRQLERETGQALFVREGRGLRLTDHGTRLFTESATLIEEHARVLRALDTSEDAHARPLRLATYEVFATHCLGPLLEAGMAARPAQVLELGVGALERAIADRQADIGITYAPVPQRGLTFRPVRDIGFRIFVKRGAFAKAPFESLPFAIPVTRIDEALSGILGIDCWPYERVPRLVKYRLTSMESALALCRRGLCAVFLPSFLAAVHNEAHPRARQLSEHPAPASLGPVTRRVHVVHRDADAGDDDVERIAAAVDALTSARQTPATRAAAAAGRRSP